MLEQVQTKDKKPIWKKLQYKGSLLVEYAIILGLAAIFLVFNGLFDPIGNKAENNAKAVNKDAYVYGGVPKGSVTQPPDNNNAPEHRPSGPDGRPIIIAGTPSLLPVNPGDKIQTNIQFTYSGKDKIWSTDTSNGIIKTKPDDKKGNTKYFSFDTLLSFGLECVSKDYKIFFNDQPNTDTTRKNDKNVVDLPVPNNDGSGETKDFGGLKIQVIIYKYNDKNELISEVLYPSYIGSTDIDQGYFPIGDVLLHIDKPCYVAFNFKGDQNLINGINDKRANNFINMFMKIMEVK